MKKNQPAIENFCTTLPSYIIEMLQNEAEKKRSTLSDVLQNILETHYSIGNWKEKLIQDIQSIAKIEMSPYGRDKWEETVSDNGKSIKVNFFIQLPFKADIVLEVDRARYSIQFIIHTTSKHYRKLFRSFYSHSRDGLLNRDMQIEEYARFATIGYKRNFTMLAIQDILSNSGFADKLIDDCMFLINIVKIHKWS